MDAVNSYEIIVVSGDTGSGKTTQIPQFLLEHGYATTKHRILVTQPRRTATIEMARRIREETELDEEVRHQV